MNVSEKLRRSCTDGAPLVNINKEKPAVPLAVRELADLLADLAVKQLKETESTTSEGN